MNRNMHYRTKSLKQLIDIYAYEVGRNNQKDAEATQGAIVLEIYARIKDTFDLLDSDPESAYQIYNQLVGH